MERNDWQGDPLGGCCGEQIINLKGSEGIEKGTRKALERLSECKSGKSHIQFKVKGKKKKKNRMSGMIHSLMTWKVK